jgi:hypothetical protein
MLLVSLRCVLTDFQLPLTRSQTVTFLVTRKRRGQWTLAAIFDSSPATDTDRRDADLHGGLRSLARPATSGMWDRTSRSCLSGMSARGSAQDDRGSCLACSRGAGGPSNPTATDISAARAANILIRCSGRELARWLRRRPGNLLLSCRRRRRDCRRCRRRQRRRPTARAFLQSVSYLSSGRNLIPHHKAALSRGPVCG